MLLSYLLPDETPYVILKSPKQEYIFTDCAFISVVGETNLGTKKLVNRVDFCEYTLQDVDLQSPGVGVTDLDGELRLIFSGKEFRIDIKKAEWESVKVLYHVLVVLQRAQKQNTRSFQLIQQSQLQPSISDPTQLNVALISLTDAAVARYNPISYKYIFERFVK